jgi:DNA-binding HxlR family transcriptional regulator
MYDRVSAVIGRKWTLDILDLLAERGQLNYAQVEDELPASSDTVTDHLELLCEHELVDRNQHSQRNVQYLLTEKGDDFLTHVADLESLLAS